MALAVVVEDEWAIRLEISDTLTQAGWEVREFASGEQAIEFLSERFKISLLVTDIRLTGVLSGWDVAEAFRSGPPTRVSSYITARQMPLLELGKLRTASSCESHAEWIVCRDPLPDSKPLSLVVEVQPLRLPSRRSITWLTPRA